MIYCKTHGCVGWPTECGYCPNCLDKAAIQLSQMQVRNAIARRPSPLEAIQAMPTFTLMERVAKIEAFLKYKYEDFR